MCMGTRMIPVCVGIIFCHVLHGYDLLRVYSFLNCVGRNFEGTIFCGLFLHCQHFWVQFWCGLSNLHWLILSLITHHIIRAHSNYCYCREILPIGQITNEIANL